MDKAFDNVRWSSLLRILEKHGFGRKWISWIRWCISISHFSVLVNGSSTEKFKPSKGLRQGDSLSPFLFLLAVEILSKLIDDVVRRDQLKGFQVVEGGINISHLQFADDTLLFVIANEEEGVKNLKCTSQALKAKWVWRYATEKKDLWRRVVQQKLKNKEEVSPPTNDDTATGRSNWKSILNNTSFVDKEVKFKLNNGKSITFWLDDWTATGALKARYPAIYKACRNKNASIDDMIENGRLTCQVRRRLN
ncbi:uncharacterized protein LOC113291843 [Papaver somniferum]|uniref:uncharacterized protein LOC113291843 n=1 Tax=Papaver somniferum TaxID=3469 RepID=UPI000E705550|nr:uncharacterized protein LOC113291843 [Papaver somniferum]